MKTIQSNECMSDKIVTDSIILSRASSKKQQAEGDLESGMGSASPRAQYSEPRDGGPSPGDSHALASSKKMSDIKLVAKKLTFIEFTRVNMRLAEDRILSFLSVFATGRGTRWTRGATFYYVPEVQWCTLLTQRR